LVGKKVLRYFKKQKPPWRHRGELRRRVEKGLTRIQKSGERNGRGPTRIEEYRVRYFELKSTLTITNTSSVGSQGKERKSKLALCDIRDEMGSIFFL